MVRGGCGRRGCLVLVAVLFLPFAGPLPGPGSTVRADEAPASAGEHALWHLTLVRGGERTDLVLDVFDVPGRTSSVARRIVLRPHEPVDGDLPLITISEDARGKRRPDLYDPRARDLVDAARSWLEAESAIEEAWGEEGVTGDARVHLPSLRLRSRIPVSHACSRDADGARVVRVTLREMVSEGTSLKTELLSLDWRLVLGEDGRITSATLARETRRRAGSIEQRDPVAISLRFTDRTPFARDEARAVVEEAETLDPIVRAHVLDQGRRVWIRDPEGREGKVW